MTAYDDPDDKPARPIWLITLADLALLLVGFFVFIQANNHLDGRKLAQVPHAEYDSSGNHPYYTLLARSVPELRRGWIDEVDLNIPGAVPAAQQHASHPSL